MGSYGAYKAQQAEAWQKEVERLNAENKRLREVLECILQEGRPEGCGDGGWACMFAQRAEDALNG